MFGDSWFNSLLCKTARIHGQRVFPAGKILLEAPRQLASNLLGLFFLGRLDEILDFAEESLELVGSEENGC